MREKGERRDTSEFRILTELISNQTILCINYLKNWTRESSYSKAIQHPR